MTTGLFSRRNVPAFYTQARSYRWISVLSVAHSIAYELCQGYLMRRAVRLAGIGLRELEPILYIVTSSSHVRGSRVGDDSGQTPRRLESVRNYLALSSFLNRIWRRVSGNYYAPKYSITFGSITNTSSSLALLNTNYPAIYPSDILLLT
jgi:hypothetical protein